MFRKNKPMSIWTQWLICIGRLARGTQANDFLPATAGEKSQRVPLLNLIYMHTSTKKRTEIIIKRIFVSGFEIEQYEYLEKPLIRNYKRRERKKKPESKNKKKAQTQKAEFSVNRTRRDIRRLVNSNSQLIKFLTLTTTSTDIAKMNKEFNLFTQRMKKHYPNFQYLAVPEFQKDVDFFGKIKPDGGTVHYHLICNLPWVDQEKIAKIWGQGFIKIRRIDHITNLGRYVCKYLQKDMFDKRMFGKKKFFRSQDLNEPVEIINNEAQSFIQDNADDLKMTWETTFQDEHRGKILYKVFNSKNRTT